MTLNSGITQGVHPSFYKPEYGQNRNKERLYMTRVHTEIQEKQEYSLHVMFSGQMEFLLLAPYTLKTNNY